MCFVITTSLMFGAEASRFEDVTTGVEMPRPTPNWSEPTSTQPLSPSWPLALLSPFLIASYFRYAAIANLQRFRSSDAAPPRGDAGDGVHAHGGRAGERAGSLRV